MKKKQTSNQRTINIIFGSLIAVLFIYSAAATYIAVQAYNGMDSAMQDLSTQMFNIWTKGDPSD